MSSSGPRIDQQSAQPPPGAPDVRTQLAKILSSDEFRQSPRAAAFLRFVVEETLKGRSGFIKGRTIAIAVFDRHQDENPDDDPIVRIQAGRVRKRLTRYYQREGSHDAVQISIPTGSYVPVFQANGAHRVGANARDGVRERAAIEHDSVARSGRLPRIGVLPLKNLADSPEYDYFADGLGEELSGELARFQGLAVLAYCTTSQLRHDALDLSAAAADLKVDFFVSGSVARIDDRIRINIQCLDAKTGHQIWGECFNRNLTTAALFDIQDEVVRKVVACVGDDYGSVSQSMFRGSENTQVADLSAYEAVLSIHDFAARLDKQTLDRTLPALQHAVEIEPSFARAWAALSQVYCNIHALRLIELDGALALAKDCVQRAMALDKNCQHTHYSSAYVGVLEKDHPRVITACENMVDLNPNAAYMVGSAAFWLGVVGRFDRAFPLLEQSQERNPYYPGWFHFVPWLHAFSEQDFDRALAAAYQFNMPTLFWDPLARAAALGKLGQDREAVKAVQELLKLRPDFASRPDFYVGCFVHSDQTRADVLEGLRAGGLT